MKVNIGKFPNGYSTKRKIDVEIHYYDTWSMSHTLALIILPMLIQLKDTKQGVPMDFAEVGGESYHDQSSFDFYTETASEAFDQKTMSWDDALDKMIWSFQQLVDEDHDSKYHHGKSKYDWKETDKTMLNPLTGQMEQMYEMVDKNPDEHWYDHVGHRLHEDRIQEGLELFGKYYQNLWD